MIVTIDGNAYKFSENESLLSSAVLVDGNIEDNWYEVSEANAQSAQALALLLELQIIPDSINDAAFKPNSRFKKIKGEAEDLHPIGAEGFILKAVGPLPDGAFANEVGYFVKFDNDKRCPIFIRGSKIERIS